MPRVIVSVKDRMEAASALEAGSTWLDVKDPASGSLGQASSKELSAIADLIAGRELVLSAALGELAETELIPEDWPWSRLEFVKVGLARQVDSQWQEKLDNLAQEIRKRGSQLVIGVYADRVAAGSPPWTTCLDYAISRKMPAILIDTHTKNSLRLLDYLNMGEVEQIIRLARENSIAVALAGSLDLRSAKRLLKLDPSFLAARGAFCQQGRSGGFDPHRVRDWLSLLQISAN